MSNSQRKVRLQRELFGSLNSLKSPEEKQLDNLDLGKVEGIRKDLSRRSNIFDFKSGTQTERLASEQAESKEFKMN